MNRRKPTVTIGIPVYNEGKYLAETIESAINQTYSNIQIIISDNHSTDNSFKIGEEFAAKYDNITLIKQEKNLGIGDNCIYLLEAADTDYFMWLGAHDIIVKKYIENSIRVLENDYKIAMVYHRANFFVDSINNIQGPDDNDIDTTNINCVKDRMYKVVLNLSSGTAIHGVFRSKLLKKLIFKNVIAGDYLVLFATAEQGHIKQIDCPGFYRRDVHRNETEEESMKRYDEYKICKSSYFYQYQYFLLLVHHIKYTFKSRNISFFDKIKLTIAIILCFKKKYLSMRYFIKQVLTIKSKSG